MNFKKFISGVSAFAIAASAFAGMAVTANAEGYSLVDGVYTWGFADYDATDSTSVTNYSVFQSYGTSAVTTNGITFPSAPSGGSISGGNYTTFTAPATGKVTVTWNSGWKTRANNSYMYADAEGATSIASVYISGATTGTMSAYVREGGTYYFFSKGTNANADYGCSASIINVTLTPSIEYSNVTSHSRTAPTTTIGYTSASETYTAPTQGGVVDVDGTVLDVTAVLDEGDTVSSNGIHWAKGAAYNSGSGTSTDNMKNNAGNRYLLVTPKISGTFNAAVTAAFSETDTTKRSNVYLRVANVTNLAA